MSQHEPDTKPVHTMGKDHEDHPEMISRNSRYGLILFTIYCLFYAGFVLISAFAPQQMATELMGGVNLAILYGIALIIGALFLASIYMYLCRATGTDTGNSADTNKTEASK